MAREVADHASLAVVNADRPADIPAVVGWGGIGNYRHQELPGISAVLRSWEERFRAILTVLMDAALPFRRRPAEVPRGVRTRRGRALRVLPEPARPAERHGLLAADLHRDDSERTGVEVMVGLARRVERRMRWRECPLATVR